jgi:hypothetical protein
MGQWRAFVMTLMNIKLRRLVEQLAVREQFREEDLV